jgi:hypothetical protein
MHEDIRPSRTTILRIEVVPSSFVCLVKMSRQQHDYDRHDTAHVDLMIRGRIEVTAQAA